MSFRQDSLFLPILKQGVLGLSISSNTGPQFPYLRNPAHLPHLKLRTMEELFAIHRSQSQGSSVQWSEGCWCLGSHSPYSKSCFCSVLALRPRVSYFSGPKAYHMQKCCCTAHSSIVRILSVTTYSSSHLPIALNKQE